MDFVRYRDRFNIHLPDEAYVEQYSKSVPTSQELIEKIDGFPNVDIVEFIHMDDWPNCERWQLVRGVWFLMREDSARCVEEIAQTLFDFSLTSNLAMAFVKNVGPSGNTLRLCIVPSPDHQTNISPEVVEAIMKKVKDHDDD